VTPSVHGRNSTFSKSSKALKLAHMLARKERRSIAQVVERASELCAHVEPEREAAQDFYSRISREYGADVDLESVIRTDRKPNPGIDL
jgi:hypothetical protein